MDDSTAAKEMRRNKTALGKPAETTKQEPALRLNLDDAEAFSASFGKPFEPNERLSEALALADRIIANTRSFRSRS